MWFEFIIVDYKVYIKLLKNKLGDFYGNMFVSIWSLSIKIMKYFIKRIGYGWEIFLLVEYLGFKDYFFMEIILYMVSGFLI